MDLPVFHIPVGRSRQDGEIVMFELDEDAHQAAMDGWNKRILERPDTVAAGGCVIIGATKTFCFDIATHSVVISDTAEGAWCPSALSDF
jgi:hypothetical protein